MVSSNGFAVFSCLFRHILQLPMLPCTGPESYESPLVKDPVTQPSENQERLPAATRSPERSELEGHQSSMKRFLGPKKMNEPSLDYYVSLQLGYWVNHFNRQRKPTIPIHPKKSLSVALVFSGISTVDWACPAPLVRSTSARFGAATALAATGTFWHLSAGAALCCWTACGTDTSSKRPVPKCGTVPSPRNSLKQSKGHKTLKRKSFEPSEGFQYSRSRSNALNGSL